AGAVNAHLRGRRLLAAQRNAVRLRAAIRRMNGQAAPAAPDVEEALASFQAQLAAYMVQLVPLRLFQRFARITKIGAGVNQRLAQPWREETHRLIVVVGDRRPIAPPRVHGPLPDPPAQLEK